MKGTGERISLLSFGKESNQRNLNAENCRFRRERLDISKAKRPSPNVKSEVKTTSLGLMTKWHLCVAFSKIYKDEVAPASLPERTHVPPIGFAANSMFVQFAKGFFGYGVCQQSGPAEMAGLFLPITQQRKEYCRYRQKTAYFLPTRGCNFADNGVYYP